MPFLLINGIELPMAVNDGAKRKTEQLGQSKRAVDGTLRIHRRGIKTIIEGRTPILDPLQGDCFRRLLLGEGHNWSFDDGTKGLYSGKGLGPSASTDAALNVLAAYQGARGVRLNATTGTITYPALPAGVRNWTVMVARNTGAGFSHYIITNTSQDGGKAWVNGVDTTVATAWLTVNTNAGTVKIDAAGTTTDIDELVVLPYRIPSDAEAAEAPWAAQIFDWIDNYSYQWAPLARLTVQGSVLYPDAPDVAAPPGLVVAGEAEETVFTHARWDATWGERSDLKQVSFKLMEV